MCYSEGREVYLDPHISPRSQLDFTCMKFKPKSIFKNYEKIKVNFYQIHGELSMLEEMTKENVDNLTIKIKTSLFKKTSRDTINRKCLHLYNI